MGYLVQLVKIACIGVFWGLVLGHWWQPFYGLLLGLLVFYFLLVAFVGTKTGIPPQQSPPDSE